MKDASLVRRRSGLISDKILRRQQDRAVRRSDLDFLRDQIPRRSPEFWDSVTDNFAWFHRRIFGPSGEQGLIRRTRVQELKFSSIGVDPIGADHPGVEEVQTIMSPGAEHASISEPVAAVVPRPRKIRSFSTFSS
jgi:hypothetical protein